MWEPWEGALLVDRPVTNGDHMDEANNVHVPRNLVLRGPSASAAPPSTREAARTTSGKTSDVRTPPGVLPGNWSVTDADTGSGGREVGCRAPGEPGLTESEAVRQFGDGIRGAVDAPLVRRPRREPTTVHHVPNSWERAVASFASILSPLSFPRIWNRQGGLCDPFS